jgi:hypothetical protein
MHPLDDRRRRRSDDTITALHYQLAAARHDGDLEALVLVDATGCLVAGAGAWPACEELAAYAPLLSDPAALDNPRVAERLASISTGTIVEQMRVDGSEVLLCGRARRGWPSREPLHRAAEGCLRILSSGGPSLLEA